MRIQSVVTRVLLFAVALSLTATVAVSGEKCRAVHAYFGPMTYLAPEECPPWDGPPLRDPGVSLTCAVVPVTGTLNGTWTFYWPVTGNAVDINTDDHPGEIVWPSGTFLETYFGVAVYQTKHGRIYTEASGHTQSELIPIGWPWATIERITGGTDTYGHATGWMGGASDEVNGGPLGGQICTPRGAPHGKGRRK